MISAHEFFVVQTRSVKEPEDWVDTDAFDDDGEAFDHADYLREGGDTEARVVRRWK
jgi:hypothetical protein